MKCFAQRVGRRVHASEPVNVSARFGRQGLEEYTESGAKRDRFGFFLVVAVLLNRAIFTATPQNPTDGLDVGHPGQGKFQQDAAEQGNTGSGDECSVGTEIPHHPLLRFTRFFRIWMDSLVNLGEWFG